MKRIHELIVTVLILVCACGGARGEASGGTPAEKRGGEWRDKCRDAWGDAWGGKWGGGVT